MAMHQALPASWFEQQAGTLGPAGPAGGLHQAALPFGSGSGAGFGDAALGVADLH